MASARQRRRTKNPLSKVRQPTKPVRNRPCVVDVVLKPHWDQSDTVASNYKKTGLARHLNNDISRRETQRRLHAWNCKRAEMGNSAFDSEEEIFAELESIFVRDVKDIGPGAQALENAAAEAQAKREELRPAGWTKPLSEDEQIYMQRLIEKHGKDNYEAMFKDIKTNFNQLSIRQLMKLGERL